MRYFTLVLTIAVATSCASSPKQASNIPPSAPAETIEIPPGAQAPEEEPPAVDDQPDDEPASGAATQPQAELSGAAGELARAVFEAAGGESLEEVAQLDFRFVVPRRPRNFEAHHRWDRENMRDRVQWKDGETSYDVMVDLRTREGWALVDGEPVEGEPLKKALEAAYGRWVNDAYWLVLPLKVLDPGVHLEREEPREHEGQRYEILKLTFDGVGLTPGDTYWLYVHPETHRIAYWEMKLQGQEEPAPLISWEKYEQVGPLTLATEHREPAGRLRVSLTDLQAHETVVPDAFERPEAP